jgi:PadR family transcriptional regulator PadR
VSRTRSRRSLGVSIALLKRGWITYAEGASENNRRANFYNLTARGRKQLEIETSKWDRLATAIARILRPAVQE